MAATQTFVFWLMVAVVVLSDKASSQNTSGPLVNITGEYKGQINATEANGGDDGNLRKILDLLSRLINATQNGGQTLPADDENNTLSQLLVLLNALCNKENTNQDNGLGDLLNLLASLSSSTNESRGVIPPDLLRTLLVCGLGRSNSVFKFVDTILNFTEAGNKVLQVLLDTPIYNLLVGYLNGDWTNGTTNSTAAFNINKLLATAVSDIQNYLYSLLRESGVDENCHNDIGVMIQGILEQQMWALQMLDAFGKPGSDILTAQLKWLGSYEECVNVEAVTYSNNMLKSDPVEQFTGKYCRATFSGGGEKRKKELVKASDWPIRIRLFIIYTTLIGIFCCASWCAMYGAIVLPPVIHLPNALFAVGNVVLGTCVPSSCSSSDITVISETVQKASMNGRVAIRAEITCVEDKEMKTDTLVVMCILIILTASVVIGTLYDVIAVQLRSSDSLDDISTKANVASKPSSSYLNNYVPAAISHNFKTNISACDPVRVNTDGYTNGGYTTSGIADNGTGDSNSKSQLGELKHNDAEMIKNDETNTDAVVQKVYRPINQRGTLAQVVLSFSAYSNGVKLLGVQQGAGTLGAINGIRFLSMCWVILAHTFYYSMASDKHSNLIKYYIDNLNDWTFIVIFYATVAVDSFFVISGILVAYLTLKELKKVGGALKMNWFLFYFHRFFRLTPPYMLVLMIGTFILPYVYSGPLWTDGEFPWMERCRENWWRNILYINNYVDKNKCMGWTWYLANDMQFYIISPLIILPLFYNLIAGGLSCLVFLTATITATALITNHHEYPAQLFSLYAPPAKDDDFMKNIYFPSYARIGPYIVGLFTGYVLYRCKCKCRIPKIINLVCWLISFCICTVSVYSLYSKDDTHIFTKEESIAYIALDRTGWGIAVAWMVFSCATGHGGWINEILSWKAFIPLGRLTYCAYLVHPLLMLLYYYGRRQATYFTDYDVVYLFFGHLMMSYGVAFVVSLLIESPMMGLEKAILAKRKKK